MGGTAGLPVRWLRRPTLRSHRHFFSEHRCLSWIWVSLRGSLVVDAHEVCPCLSLLREDKKTAMHSNCESREQWACRKGGDNLWSLFGCSEPSAVGREYWHVMELAPALVKMLQWIRGPGFQMLSIVMPPSPSSQHGPSQQLMNCPVGP